MTATRPSVQGVEELYARASGSFDDWELVKDVIDEAIDLTLNYRRGVRTGGSSAQNVMGIAKRGTSA